MMKYKFKKRITHPNVLDIDFTPANQSLSAIFAQVRKSNYPEFIIDISKSESTGYEFVHIKNYKDMDWEDRIWAREFKGSELEEGELFLVHDVMGKTIISEEVFDGILFDYGTELLRENRTNDKLPNDWESQMEDALCMLMQKIENRKT